MLLASWGAGAIILESVVAYGTEANNVGGDHGEGMKLVKVENRDARDEEKR